MKTERTVHFKVIGKGRTKQLRGLLYLEEGREPTMEDFARCLKACGHDARLVDKEHAIFEVESKDGEYLIDVLEDYDERASGRDPQAEAMARQFLNDRRS